MSTIKHEVAVAVVLYDKHGSVLLQHRKKEFGHDLYVLPGGMLEEHEPHTGAIREVKEELGITVKGLIPIWVANDVKADGSPLLMLYYAAFVSDDLAKEIQNREPEKCYGLHWRPANEAAHAPDMWLNDKLAVSSAIGLLRIWTPTAQPNLQGLS